MSDVDDQIAAERAATQARIDALVAKAKAEENAKALTGSQLNDEQLSEKLETIKAANGAAAPHPSFHALLDLVKHLLSQSKAHEAGPVE
jgi:hypothetical protein